jgi:hypothetical protein
MPANSLDTLRQTKTIQLTTYKRNGEPVATPVSIAFDGDRAFFRTYDKAWKAKRLRNHPEVEAAPSTMAGKATGDSIHARARLLDGEDAKRAARAIQKNQRVLQGVLVPVFHRLKRYRTLHYELIA